MTQHHLLIGPPGSGKTTFAHTLQKHLPPSDLISTDEIRRQCYGDPSVQGSWPDIFTEVKNQCQKTIVAGRTVIYDATNAKRPWRFSFLRELLAAYPEDTWVGWHLQTPLKTCLEWNRRRERQVPTAVIQEMYEALKAFPPDPAEGMTIVYVITPNIVRSLVTHENPELDHQLEKRLSQIPRKIINQRNATKNSRGSFHAYSDFLAFERLLYLLRVLLEYPGAGTLRHRLTQIPKSIAAAQSDLDELSILLSEYHPIYGDRSALVENLNWLYQNGFLSADPCPPEWMLTEQPPPSIVTHGYSDRNRFLRLMGILRFMLHHPFYDAEGGSLEALTQGLRSQNILYGSPNQCRDTLRKDIQLILKPYGLLQPHRYKKGYFLGTGIFSQTQLLQLHQLLAGQAKSLADPTVLDLLTTLSDRLQWSKLSSLKPYPVRALYNFSITNQKHLPSEALANTIDRLEQEIEQGQCLELQRFAGVGRHGTEPDTFFLAWPVQMVFHNIGWYLGYEMATGDQKGLFAFQRLDRLFRGRPGGQQRDRKAQERACQHLEELFKASGGLFLGENASHQRQWLSGQTDSPGLTVLLELWCTDRAFRFISEGDQRFPETQIQLSPRLPDSMRPGNPKIFRLKPTGDPIYPHRFQVKLPYWAIKGIDLQRWIWGFKAEVRVMSPPDLVEQLRQDVKAIEDVLFPMT